MLHYCDTCGRLFTAHAYKAHQRPICLPRDKDLEGLGLFNIILDAHQIKISGYTTNSYWASMGMFNGLQSDCIPWTWIRNKGLLLMAYNHPTKHSPLNEDYDACIGGREEKTNPRSGNRVRLDTPSQRSELLQGITQNIRSSHDVFGVGTAQSVFEFE